VQIPLAGEHQAANAAVALCAIDVLAEKGWQVSDEQVHAGLKGVRWPARIERLTERPTVIVDAAHNLASVQALIKTLHQGAGDKDRWILIFAGTKDKDVPELLGALLPEFDTVILTRYTTNPRAVDVGELASVAESIGGGSVRTAADPAVAWRLARQIARPEDLICVTGSFFIAAEIREIVVGQKSALPERTAPIDASSRR
jgi:dihydrofolate synthase/folylpolyglutamate synthase